MAGRLIAGAFVLMVAMGSVAWAASSVVQSRDLASGFGTVAACDHAPNWSYTFTKDGNGGVSSAVVNGIAASCLGGSMRLTLSGPVVSAVALPVTITNCPSLCTVTVPFVNGPLPSQVTTANALIVGP